MGYEIESLTQIRDSTHGQLNSDFQIKSRDMTTIVRKTTRLVAFFAYTTQYFPGCIK